MQKVYVIMFNRLPEAVVEGTEVQAVLLRDKLESEWKLKQRWYALPARWHIKTVPLYR